LPVCGWKPREAREVETENKKEAEFWSKKSDRARSHSLLCPDLNNAFVVCPPTFLKMAKPSVLLLVAQTHLHIKVSAIA